MSTTIGDICEQAHDFINRNDQQQFVERAAVHVYKQICARIPFEELQAIAAPYVLPGSTTQLDYTAGPGIMNLAGIYSIKLIDGTAVRRIKKTEMREFDSLPVNLPGPPSRYARFGANTIYFDRPGNGSATIEMKYWQKPLIDVIPQNTTIITPENWDELLVWETIFRALTKLKRNDEAMSLMMGPQLPDGPGTRKTYMRSAGIIPRLWNDLLATMRQIESFDDDFGVKPLIGLGA